MTEARLKPFSPWSWYLCPNASAYCACDLPPLTLPFFPLAFFCPVCPLILHIPVTTGPVCVTCSSILKLFLLQPHYSHQPLTCSLQPDVAYIGPPMEAQNDPAEMQQFTPLGFPYLHCLMSSGSLNHATACRCLVTACFPISNHWFFPWQSWALEIPLWYFRLSICAFCFLHVPSSRYFLLIF